MKKLLILIVIALSMQACVKDKSDYYLNQPRDPDLVGYWTFEGNNSATRTQYTEFRADGMLYTYINDNGNIYNTGIKEYWYTKDGIIYRYEYRGEWVADSKGQNTYYFSEDKTKVWFGNMQDPYIRTTLPE